MIYAYSRLWRVLREHNMTVSELHRRLQRQGLRINVKRLYRLFNDRLPLQRLDLRVAGAICKEFALPLSDLITFEATRRKLRRLTAAKQKYLDSLMAKGNEGRLTKAERQELQVLVREAEGIMLDNARRLVGPRQQLTAP